MATTDSSPSRTDEWELFMESLMVNINRDFNIHIASCKECLIKHREITNHLIKVRVEETKKAINKNKGNEDT